MANVKKLDTSNFAELQKELTATIEVLRARQDEKQALFDEFDRECKRFFFGKISERALASSVKKTNKEKQRLDNEIRVAIKKARNLSGSEMRMISRQTPTNFKVSLTGVSSVKKKKPVKRKKRVVKKRSVAKKKKTKKK